MKFVCVPVVIVGSLLLIRLLLPVSDALIVGSFILLQCRRLGLRLRTKKFITATSKMQSVYVGGDDFIRCRRPAVIFVANGDFMRILKDILYDEKYENCRLDLYLPCSNEFDTVVYFHGGGLTGGHKDDFYYAEMAGKFAEKGLAFASVEYRKYPTAKYPDFLEDCAAATAFMQKRIGGIRRQRKDFCFGAVGGGMD